MSTIFISGIHTGCGKTVASAVVCCGLAADYWKPVQSGTNEGTDTDWVRQYLPGHPGIFHPEAFQFKAPLSPHAAARLEQKEIKLKEIHRPETDNTLVIEGAGGLLVPLNQEEVIGDLIFPEDKVVLVSGHYLGSINHTLLSVQWLNNRGIQPGILFNGRENVETERVIAQMSDAHIIGRIDAAEDLNPGFIGKQADKLKRKLMNWLEQ